MTVMRVDASPDGFMVYFPPLQATQLRMIAAAVLSAVVKAGIPVQDVVDDMTDAKDIRFSIVPPHGATGDA